MKTNYLCYYIIYKKRRSKGRKKKTRTNIHILYESMSIC